MINYSTVEAVYSRNFCSERLYKRGYCNNLVYTEGVMDFQKSLNAFWVVDNVVSYMSEIIKSYKDNEYDFFVLEIAVNKDNTGIIDAYAEGYLEDRYEDHISIIRQEIPYIDLPTKVDNEITTYKFYLELSSITPIVFTLLLPSEH